MSTRQDHKQETRRRILAAAGAALREQGLGAPTVSQVMADAGLTVGGFYAHFPSRDALMEEALADLLESQMQRWLAWLPNLPPAPRRQQAARGYLSRAHRDTTAERCPIPALASEIDRADPAIRTVVARHLEAWVAALSDADEPEGRQLALAAVATMVGALTLARALGANALSDELLLAAKAAVR